MLEIIYGILIAWFFAEFIGAIFHHWEDAYGNPAWRTSESWFKRKLYYMIIESNIEHHKIPAAFARRSYWSRNGYTIIPCVVGAVAFYWYWPICLGFILLSQMNEFHYFSHVKCNRFIRFFQSLGILQSPKHHKIHHTKPFNRNYSIMSNMLNPVLEFIFFWQFWEFLIWCTTGALPLEIRKEA